MDYDSIADSLIDHRGFIRQPAPYGLVRVEGPEAVDFLHRMCSQDVVSMGPGELRPTAFMDGKGRLLAVAEMLRHDHGVCLSTPSGLVESLAEMLERFHFTEQLDIVVDADAVCVDLVSRAPTAAVAPGHGVLGEDGVLELAGQRGILHWRRCHGPAEAVASRLGTTVPTADPKSAACLRFLLREPLVGVDSEPNTLALEWGLGDHISTTKGCYTGQEVVARIHTYGHTNRSLCLLGCIDLTGVEASTPLFETAEGDPVGRVMSSAALPGDAGGLAFGFLPNEFTVVGTELALVAADGPRVVVL